MAESLWVLSTFFQPPLLSVIKVVAPDRPHDWAEVVAGGYGRIMSLRAMLTNGFYAGATQLHLVQQVTAAPTVFCAAVIASFASSAKPWSEAP